MNNDKLKNTNKGRLLLGIIYLLIMLIGIVFSFIATTISNPDNLTFVSYFNYGADLVSMLGLFVLAIISSFDKKLTDSGHYYAILFLIHLGLLFDVLCCFTEGRPEFALAQNIFTYISYLIPLLIILIFIFYQNSLFLITEKTSKLSFILVGLFFVIGLAVLGLNIPYNYLFIINEEGVYVATQYEFITIICPAIIVLISLFTNLRRKLTKRKRLPLLLFSIIPVVSASFSAINPNFSTLFPTLALTMILLFGSIQMEKSVELATAIEDVSKKEQEILLSQIQPHFLYNTLGAISALCDMDPKLARQATNKFADYLRGNMAALKNGEPIAFEKEMSHVKNYLWIEQLRFKDRLKVEYEITETNFKLPALSLQPIVENAVKHGILVKDEGGKITIKSYKEEDLFIVEVIDDGVGFDTSKTYDNSHVGIENVRSRLSSMVNGQLFISSRINEGTIARIIIKE